MGKTAGIDIGSDSVKLIELEDRKGHITLTGVAISRVSNNDKASALKELLAQSKSALKRVNVSLSGPSVIVRYIEMPPMKKDELKSAIKFEAEKYIPFNINESIVDCAVLEKISSGSHRVLLAAAKKQEIDSLMQFFKGFGLEIGAVDVDSFAFFNSFERAVARDKKEEDAYALLNIGSRFSNINIVSKGSLYFTRDIFWGGSDITVRIKDIMGLGAEDAEALKKNPAEKRNQVLSAIAPALEKLTQQIRMSFDYFETQFGKNVEKIYISGGSSYLFNMVDFLKDNLRVDVMMWDPFEGIKMDATVKDTGLHPAVFAVAVGLALRK